MKRPLLSVGLVSGGLLLAALFWLVRNSRAATETPDYNVVRTEGAFEIRDYPALALVSTPMKEDQGMNGSFGKLFGFITGKNDGAQKIEMTTPVLIDTAPAERTISFIVPKLTVEKGVPAPSAPEVKLGNLSASRFATLRFGGGRSAENEKKAVSALEEWLAANKLKAKGPPLFAYYDPPWTPPFMRRNEVFIAIEKKP